MTTDIEALAMRLATDLDVSDGDTMAAALLIQEQADRIQALEAKCAELGIALTAMADEFVKVCPVYYYTEPWAHDRNAVLKSARDVIAAQAGSKEGGK
jgi:hypothetical protein